MQGLPDVGYSWRGLLPAAAQGRCLLVCPLRAASPQLFGADGAPAYRTDSPTPAGVGAVQVWVPAANRSPQTALLVAWFA